MGSSVSSCYRGSDNLKEYVPIARNNSSWRVFTYEELDKATNGFNEDNKLGEEGSGSVYRGKTIDGLQIAVKKLKAINLQVAVEVGRVHHKNLLGLRGFCAGTDQRLIVYDYMPNLSLLSHLHGQFANELQLDWKRRMNIATGCAEGLLYLHDEVTPHIIHRNIKASNVLLDSNFEPVVAGLKIAKLIPDGVDQITTRVKGSLGYLAPEYAVWGKVSRSCDVYSFGILLLELVTGRKTIEKLPGGIKIRTIIEWAEPFIVNERFEDLVDPKLRGNLNENQLKQVINIATLCAHVEPEKRPNMKEVVNLLKGDETVGKLLQMRMEGIKCEEDTVWGPYREPIPLDLGEITLVSVSDTIRHYFDFGTISWCRADDIQFGHATLPSLGCARLRLHPSATALSGQSPRKVSDGTSAITRSGQDQAQCD